jgi:hypothetical protein
MAINPHSHIDKGVQAARALRRVGIVPTGSGTTFTLPETPISGTLEFKVNGIALKSGATAGGYTRSGVTITTTETHASDAEALANYEVLA